MSLGKRLSQLRKSKGLTQEEASKLLNISRSRIALYETDKRDIDTDTLREFAEFYNITIDYLVGRVVQCAPTKTEPALPQFSPDELALIEKYRKMKDDEKDTMHKVANHISPDEQAAAAGK